MYHRNPHFSDVDSSARFEVRFSSTQGARLCLAIACIPHSITYSDCMLKCLCNEENWNFLFPRGLISVSSHDILTGCSSNCKSNPENVTAI